MPSPSTSLATLRPDLGDSLQEFDFEMGQRGFIAHRVLPVFETMQQSGPFGKIPIEQLLKNVETARRNRAGYSRGEYDFTADTYATAEHGHEQVVDDRDAAMYANYFDAELVAAQIALDVVLRNAEKRAAALLFNASTFSATSITNEWDDKTNATPVDDINASKLRVFNSCGMWPNAVIINQQVFDNVRITDQVRDHVASAGSGDPARLGDITAAMLANVFGVEEVIVGNAAKNTANEGQAASISQIWSNEYVMTAKIARSPNIKEPCVGRTFHWAGDGSTIGGLVESYRDETARGDVVRVRHDVDEKLLITACADLMDNATT